MTSELLKALDEQVRTPAVQPRKLADEDYRLEVAEQQGRRAVVDWLLAIQRRQREESQ